MSANNWQDATLPSLEVIRLILLVQRELYEATGSWPSAAAVLEKLRKPGL